MRVSHVAAFADGRLYGSFVYMLLCRDENFLYVKIGITDLPSARLSSLLVGCPVEPISFSYAHIPTRGRAKSIENILHDSVKRWIARGEWYRLPKEECKEFKLAWRTAIAPFDRPLWRIKWITISVAAMREYGKLQKSLSRLRPRKRKQKGLSYKDFRRHTMTA